MLYVSVNVKFWSWMFVGSQCSGKYLAFAKHESVGTFISGLSWLDFMHLREVMVLSYNFLKRALSSSTMCY